MPVLRGSVTFARFRSEPAGKRASDTRRWLARGLARGAFEPLDVERGEDDRAAGFVSLEDVDGTDFSAGVLQGERALFGYRVDAIRVPAAAVRVELDRWTAAFVEEHGRPPARGEKTQQRDLVRHALRLRTTPSTRVHDVSWNLKTGELLVWASSRKTVEEVAAAVEAALEVKLQPRSTSALAVAARISESALAPTTELIGLGAGEVLHGEA
jgi:recombination associated protein RdgC